MTAPHDPAAVAARLAERNLAYGLLWMMSIDTRDPNLNLASRARALLLQGMTKEDQRDGIKRAIDLIPEDQAKAVMDLSVSRLVGDDRHHLENGAQHDHRH